MESFELALLGGVTERQYRSHRPDIETLPWGTLNTSAYTEEELARACFHWTDLCLEEYSATARQAELLRLLVCARAPIDLTGVLSGFPLDELLHTELCARMAAELGATAAIEYQPAQVFPLDTHSNSATQSFLLHATRMVLWEFCVQESRSHALLVSHYTHASDPLLRAVWGRLAKDEAVHMQFGWTFLSWALEELTHEERKTLTDVTAQAIAAVAALDDRVRALPASSFTPISVFGSRGRDAYLDTCAQILRERVKEPLAALQLLPQHT